jgi:hypothetical protein
MAILIFAGAAACNRILCDAEDLKITQQGAICCGLFPNSRIDSVLTGNTSDDFAKLKFGDTPIQQIVCPRPVPVSEIEGKTVYCDNV